MSNPHYQITFFGPNTESGYDLEFIDATTNQKYGIWEPDLDELKHDFDDFNTVDDLDTNIEILQAIQYARELKKHPEYYQTNFAELANPIYEIEAI